MKAFIPYIAYLLISISLVACSHDIQITGTLDEDPTIFPDYKEVTIPVNIAPLNFVVQEAKGQSLQLVIEGQQQKINVTGDDGCFQIPQKAWKKLLEAEQGHDIKLTVCKKVNGEWKSMKPFSISIVPDKVDKYIAYRLVAPGYIFWEKMGIYQRNLENFDQTPIFENKITTYNCVNCHSFPNRNPEKMVFHMRARHAGMVYLDHDKIEKLNTKTDQTITPLVYPYWHPSEKYAAFSTNQTRLAVFTHNVNYMEVYDFESDIELYNFEKHEIFSSPLLSSKKAFETFPTFSPDGKSLYFCSADSVAPMPGSYLDTHYSLCRIDFDAETETFGDKVDTLYNARETKMSVSFPRISPDGKYLVFTLHKYGNFSIWQKDADLYMLNLTDNNIYPLKEINTDQSESYHSWSDNNRWMVFSSRRIDGLYTRPFFTYIDENGKAHKPFMLPQKNPQQFYDNLLYSYNIPEFIKDKVTFDRHAIAKHMRESDGIDVTYKK